MNAKNINPTDLAKQLFNHFAEQYQRQFMDVSAYRKGLDLLCETIAEDSVVLELGCGPGNITQYLLKQKPTLNILGTDIAPNMLELARTNNPTAQFMTLDCRKLLHLNKAFAAVVCGFCLPYLSKEEAAQLIADARKTLHKGGLLYLSTMEGDYSKSGLKSPSTGGDLQAYIYYHQAAFLQQCLAENGFEEMHLQRIQSTATDGQGVTDLILMARKV